ncbi:hypothetical protein [Arthrobacter sp. AOP36-C1-22]|uniref:hypothetical protein n=1 Tax=Arthrobacter sp. AOP36-C1-22 TaxID=3457683 RepID=UPI004034605E
MILLRWTRTMIDTRALENWPDPSALEGTGKSLRASGKKFSSKVDDASGTWGGVLNHYSSQNHSDEANVTNAFRVIKTQGSLVEGACDAGATTLENYAGEVRTLIVGRRATALERIDRHHELIADGEDLSPNSIYDESNLQAYVDGTGRRLSEIGDKYSKELDGISFETLDNDGWIASDDRTALTSSGMALAKWFDADTVNFKYTRVTVTRWTAWDVTKMTPSADFIVDSKGVASTPPSTYKVTARSGISMSKLEINGTLKKYVNRTTTGPAPWDVKGRLDHMTDGLKNGSRYTKFVRGAGPVLAIASTGITYHDQWTQSMADTAQEHPDWTQDQIKSRAREETVVKGTTKAAVDFGAGAAGAGIGMMIGGPVGAGVGFVAGIGISWAIDHWGGRDALADEMMDVYDGAKETAAKVKDAGKKVWHSIFG